MELFRKLFLVVALVTGFAFPAISQVNTPIGPGGISLVGPSVLESVQIFPPALFWVGGTGNTSDPAHWALTTGGTSGAGIPGSNTAITFDSNSGTTATVTVDSALRAKSITINKSDLTLSDSSGMTVSGAVTLTTGKLLMNGHTETWGNFASAGTAARTLNIANSTINLTLGSITSWSISSATGLTSTVTGSTINLLGFSAGASLSTLTLPNIVFSGGGAMSLGSGTAGNFTVLGNNSSLFDNVLNVNTWTFTGTMTISGFSQANRVLVLGANSVATTITAAAVALSNAEFRHVTGAGAATWSGTALGDVGGNTNITFTTPINAHWVLNGGLWSDPSHWSLTLGGASSGLTPLPQDTALFDSGSFTLPGQSVTMNYSQYSNMDWTGVTNTPNMLLLDGGNFCGNVTLSSGMTTSNTANFNKMTFYAIGKSFTLTTNGVTFGASIAINAVGSTLTLGSDFVQAAGANPSGGLGLTVSSGTISGNNFNVTLAGQVTLTGSTTRALTMGSGLWTLQTLTGTIWNAASTGLTFSAGPIKILAPSAPTGNRTFAGGGLTYGTVEWGAEGATSTLIVTGANTFGTLQVDADTAPRTLTLPASTTQTATTISLNGAAGNLLTVNSSAPGTQATLSQTVGVVAATFLSLQDQAATGGAAFAATSSVNVSNNSGWTITP